jgi:formamidopyrimidine-DNA glycosylase
VRKFAKITLLDSDNIHNSSHLKDIGPEPLFKEFTFDKFEQRLQIKPNGKIKQVLMDQSILAGIGNIYADESLWRSGIHPAALVKNIPINIKRFLCKAIKNTLTKGIDLGGDSMQDYRNVLGLKGKFQEHHGVYQKTGMKCDKRGCRGKIIRIVLGGRGTHLCDAHQKMWK